MPMREVACIKPKNVGHWKRARLWQSSANHVCLWPEQSIICDPESSKDKTWTKNL